MVHYKKTNVAVEGHVGEFAGAIVVDNTGDFVCKHAKAQHVGNGLVVEDVDDVVMLSCVGNVVGGIGIVGFVRPGMLGSGTEAGTWMRGCFEMAEQILLHIRFMWPFEAVMLGGRYLATFSP